MSDRLCMQPVQYGKEPEPVRGCPWYDSGDCGLFFLSDGFPFTNDVYPCLYVDEME